MKSNKNHHLEYQKQFFDSHCDVFRQPIAEEIEERTRRIVQAAGLKPDSKVVDVGTGTGVLIKHFLEQGVAASNVLGCDLSNRMLEEAAQRYPGVRFWQGDFVEFHGPESFADAIFFNACFGNIFDQDRALATASQVAKSGAAIVISQPLGNEFLERLQQQYPQLVLTLMPGKDKLENWANRLQLSLEKLEDNPDFYLCVLRKSGFQ